MVERVIVYGHENVTAMHRTTIEVTKDPEISRRADCIIGVRANKGISELSEEFRALARDENAQIKAVFSAGGLEEVVTGWGHPELSFAHKTDMVFRKSDFICPRTLMIRADKACVDLDRKIVEKLKDWKQKVIVEISVTG